MCKIVLILCFILFILVGCTSKPINSSNNEYNQNQNQIITTSETSERITRDLANMIYDTNQIYIDQIINDKSILSDEAIKSIKGLIDIKTKSADETYQKLLVSNLSNGDEVDTLGNALKKLESMENNLSQYKDSIDSKRKLLEDWKIVLNYWRTYTEIRKNKQ